MRHIFLLLLLPIASLITCSPAFAQYVLFQDDFENGADQWSAQHPWHLAPVSDPCVVMSSPPPSFGTVARAGDADCTYNSICPVGTNVCWRRQGLLTADHFFIPADAVNPRIEFDSYVDAELGGFDITDVYLLTSDSTKYRVGLITDRGAWHSVSLDLSPWIGEQVRIGFLLYTIDWVNNDGLGWLVDNVRVVADCGSQNYCIAASNSVSPTGAIIGHTGSLQLAQNNSALTLQDGPPGQTALFFYGPFQNFAPVAQGYLCVKPDQFGYRRLLPPMQIDANGDVSYPIDFTALTGAHTLLPGVEMNFQCWYRDMVGGISVSNFSDAQTITFCP